MKTIGFISRMVATMALLALIAPVPASARMKDMPMKDHREGHGPMMEMGAMDRMGDMMGMCLEHADKIGLSEDQVAKMKPLHREMEKKQVRFKADVKIAELELKEVMEVKDFDLEKATGIVRKISDAKTAHHIEMLKSMKEIRTILTDEQFRKMKQMMPMKAGMKKSPMKPAKKQ